MKERVGDEKVKIISVAVRGINDHIHDIDNADDTIYNTSNIALSPSFVHNRIIFSHLVAL